MPLSDSHIIEANCSVYQNGVELPTVDLVAHPVGCPHDSTLLTVCLLRVSRVLREYPLVTNSPGWCPWTGNPDVLLVVNMDDLGPWTIKDRRSTGPDALPCKAHDVW